MSHPSDLSQYGYQVEKELGQNSAGGRITYLATEIQTQQQVLIKQFQFARSQSNWNDYEAYQREIQILQQLNHPSIPRYLESFETDTGFCLVQEYKNAPSLAQPRHWTPAEVKQIAVAILEVLIYLQKQNPAIIHRDLKPENILVDRKGKLTIYLVDFGFASFGNKEVAVSSVVKGTLGFMPPEQIFNRQLTTASDLYSLGMTLICLLTGTKSIEIGNLIDESYQINFKPLLPKLNPQFITWLSKMTASSLKQRYPNAIVALAGLLTSKVNIGLPVVTRVLVCVTPIIVIVTIVSIASIEAIKFSIHAIEATTRNVSMSIGLSNSTDPMRRFLITKQCPNCDLKSANLETANLEKAFLPYANLSKANLGRAKLTNASMRGVYLHYTYLVSANLEGAYLGAAELENANLRDINLESASLENARLINTDLKNANLKRANLTDAILLDANLENANLENANLGTNGKRGTYGTYLGHANLRNANLQSAILNSANLEDANLSYANLTDANLSSANLERANLSYANLTDASLGGANLRNANLSGARLNGSFLYQADLRGATMPDGSIHP